MKKLIQNRNKIQGAVYQEPDINLLMINYLKKNIVKKVRDKVKEEMKTQETDEQKEGLYEKLVVGEFMGQRNLIMRLARQKFKKINVELAGVNPRIGKLKEAARAEEESKTAEKEKELQETPAEKLQKQLDLIAQVKQQKDFKLKKVNLKAL